MIVQTRTNEESLYWGSLQTPQGLCTVFATDKGICWMGTPGTEREYGLNWLGKRMKIGQISEDGQAVESLAQALKELDRYFAGERMQFSCQLDLRGTAFQISVWQELYRIPYGQLRSYAQIAQTIGRPNAVRAVGAANGANPIAVIVPCHRVIGSNGSLTGYGGGLPMKQWLLNLEGAPLAQ